jgi:hypothetical protein
VREIKKVGAENKNAPTDFPVGACVFWDGSFAALGVVADAANDLCADNLLETGLLQRVELVL